MWKESACPSVCLCVQHVCARVHSCVYAHVHACLRVCMHAFMRACMGASACMHGCRGACLTLCICVCVNMTVHTRVRVYACARSHAHTVMQAWPVSPGSPQPLFPDSCQGDTVGAPEPSRMLHATCPCPGARSRGCKAKGSRRVRRRCCRVLGARGRT